MFRITHSISAALALLLALPFSASVQAGGVKINAPSDTETAQHTVSNNTSYVNNLIVKFKGSTGGTDKERLSIARVGAERTQRIAAVAARHGVSVTFARRLAVGADVFHLDHPIKRADAFRLAMQVGRENPDVQYAEPDLPVHIMSTAYTPNDPDFSLQWDLFEPTGGMNAQAAWSTTLGQGAVVAVIDTGIRPHPDLVANTLPGYNFFTTPGQPSGTGWSADPTDPGDACPQNGNPSSWHGTHVAGTIAAVANNGIGISGVAPQAKVVPIRVLGPCGGANSDIADAMIWAAGGTVQGVPANANPAKVMNLSLGGENPCSNLMHDTVQQVLAMGSTVVVAAGNASHNVRDDEPASCPGVIAVGSTNRSGARAYYSNYGAMITVSAPGGEMNSATDPNGILSTLNDGQTTPGNDIYGYYQGTSQATPHVAGTIALMLSVNPKLTPAQMRQALVSTARPFPAYCAGCGAGIIDAAAAVGAAAGMKK